MHMPLAASGCQILHIPLGSQMIRLPCTRLVFCIYLAQIPRGFQNQLQILRCIFKCFCSADTQSDILFQFLLDLIQASPCFHCIGCISAEIFLISGIIRADDLSRLLCVSKQTVLITVILRLPSFDIETAEYWSASFHYHRLPTENRYCPQPYSG